MSGVVTAPRKQLEREDVFTLTGAIERSCDMFETFVDFSEDPISHITRDEVEEVFGLCPFLATQRKVGVISDAFLDALIATFQRKMEQWEDSDEDTLVCMNDLVDQITSPIPGMDKDEDVSLFLRRVRDLDGIDTLTDAIATVLEIDLGRFLPIAVDQNNKVENQVVLCALVIVYAMIMRRIVLDSD